MLKNIKQYSYDVNTDDFDELCSIAKDYNRARNYIYSRYSGIKSYNIIKKSRKNIRDVWTKSGKIDEWNINSRYIRNAIEVCAANIKTSWTQTLDDVREHINKNEKDDRVSHFMYTILKYDNYLFKVLNKEDVVIKHFDDISNNKKKKIYSKIRRLIRDNKPTISKARSLSMQLDEAMYSYENGYIKIMSNTKNKRLCFKVNTNYRFKGNICLKIMHDRIVISRAIDIETKPIEYEQNIIAIDRNKINMFDTNNAHSYGEWFGELSDVHSDLLYEVNKKRQPYHSKIKELENKENKTEKDIQKINNIKKFNLGKVKYDKRKNRFDENMRKYINSTIKDLINKENPKEIVVERLDFTVPNKNKSKKKRFSKKTNRKLSSWAKGIVIDRLKYNTELNEIKLTEVNAAYTSQECPFCHHLGEKRNDIFYCPNRQCEANVGVHSGHMAAKVILQRSSDKEITLKTKHKDVKKILLKRLEEIKKPIQPRPNDT